MIGLYIHQVADDAVRDEDARTCQAQMPIARLLQFMTYQIRDSHPLTIGGKTRAEPGGEQIQAQTFTGT